MSVMMDSPTLNVSMKPLMLTTSNTSVQDTAGHESSLGDVNRDNVEEDRRHEAPYTEGMALTLDNVFE